MTKKFCILCFVIVLLSSCGTTRINRTSDFAPMQHISELEGCYLNRVKEPIHKKYPDQLRTNFLLSLFNIYDYADFVTLSTEGTDVIQLTYHTDSIPQERVFKGQMRGKFLEIYFSRKQKWFPLLYSSCDIDRLRIGKSKDGKLLIRNFSDQSGNILFLGGGHSYEEPYVFPFSTVYQDLMPTKAGDGCWGYTDASGAWIIPADYDFAALFEHDFAWVKLRQKWGLIDRSGKELIAPVYDRIVFQESTQEPLFKVSIGKKTGVADLYGNVIIPVKYDYVGEMRKDGLTTIKLNGKYGYASPAGIVIPAIYSSTNGFIGNFALVKRNGVYYKIDKEGYEYETSGIGIMRDPKLKTKRKIALEEGVTE